MAAERVSLEELTAVVAARRGADPSNSYTAKLLAGGVGKCAQKLGEEAVETVIAALAGDRAAIRAEAADLLYHLAVVLAAADVDIEEVYAELGRRTGMSGLQEKASRPS